MVWDLFRPRISRAVSALVLVSCLGEAPLAWGADTEPSAQELWAWYGEASRLHDQGKVNEAWRLYKKIWKYKQTYDVAASMGEICARRAQFALAARYYRFAIETVVPTQSPDFVKAVNEEYSKARREITEVELSTSPKQVEGLRILDEENDVVLEQPLFLEVGNHRLRAEAPGYATVTKFVAAQPGAVVQWDIELTPLSEVVADDPRTAKTRHPALVFGVGGAVTLGLGAGAYWMNHKANQQYDEAEQLGAALPSTGCFAGADSARCDELQAASDRAYRSEKISIGLAAGAGLAAVTTVLVYWLWESDQEVSVSLAPLPNDGWKLGFTHAF